MAALTSEVSIVRAAGGVVVRDGAGGEPEIVLVHRPRYDDWSLPKGKCEPGETDEVCAVREVTEETGLVCQPLRELAPVSYRDAKGRPKVVRYWTMRVVGGELDVASPREVDDVAWVGASETAARLTYDRDVAVVSEAMGKVR